MLQPPGECFRGAGDGFVAIRLLPVVVQPRWAVMGSASKHGFSISVLQHHILKCTVVELEAWDKQTDGRTGRSIAKCPPSLSGGIVTTVDLYTAMIYSA